MHYRHHYHAGNFADVAKHVLLIGLLQALSRKDKPWFFLDTHGGAGYYDLRDAAAAKTAEWRDGIGRLEGFSAQAEPLAQYLQLTRDSSAYPGSPLIAARLARKGDRIAACERIEEVASQLHQNMLRRAGLAEWVVHLRDGYEAASLLPPPEKRGLVLIDPPFERPDEFDAIIEFLKTAHSRFSGGQFAVWYPVKKRYDADRFVRRAAALSSKPVVDFRFDNGAPAQGQMRLCGVLVVNPPFRFAEEMRPALDLVARELSQGAQSHIETRLIKTEDQCRTS